MRIYMHRLELRGKDNRRSDNCEKKKGEGGRRDLYKTKTGVGEQRMAEIKAGKASFGGAMAHNPTISESIRSPFSPNE